MPKFRIYALATASKFLGEFEAESESAAIEMSDKVDQSMSLCYQCSGKIDIGDIYDVAVERVEDNQTEE